MHLYASPSSCAMLASARACVLRAPVPRSGCAPPRRHAVAMAAAEPSLWPARSDSWLELGGRVALVTGGAAGIGRACAIELLRCGCAVALADKAHADKGEAEARELARTTGGRCVFVACDVSDRASIEAAVATAERELGPLHVVVANAGINIPGVLVDLGGQDEVSDQDWDRMFSINVKGTLHTARAAVRTFLARGAAVEDAPQDAPVLVCMTSESGLAGSSGQSAYAATKAAIYSMSVRVVGVAPGVVERTALRSEAYEESLARARHESVDELRGSYKAGIPLAREAQLGEIANVVAFVASRRASYLTGVTLNVSGGKSWL